MQLQHGALVEDGLHERVHVVGALDRVGQQGPEVEVVDLRDIEASLRAEQVSRLASPVECLPLGVGQDVNDTGATAVRLGTAQAQHVHVLAGHRSNDVGPGHEDATLGPEDHHVGEGRSVSRAASSRAEYDGDLRDDARRLGHDVEDAADGV